VTGVPIDGRVTEERWCALEDSARMTERRASGTAGRSHRLRRHFKERMSFPKSTK
jgi:hypothetical protein